MRALNEQLQTTRQQLEQITSHHEALARELRELKQSRSWRVTRPLRYLGRKTHSLVAAESVTSLDESSSTPSVPAKTQRRWPTAPIDIIVPVYKGLEETRDCLESVWGSSPNHPWRLVVINDASPEAELSEWLRATARAKDPDRPMILLENPENLGFVGTVNRGMALSGDADVVLLNSDAEVANDWLDRMVAAAYRDNSYPAGTVTPFSNNATICSYPSFCEDNELPPGYTLPDLDRLFAEANTGHSVDVPTGVGFCMYIRRDCLDAVGLFDEASFGKGYGEENDFCMRALKAGWRNLHALDVFAWHKGSVSFGASQPDRVTKALDIMNRLHPDYDRRVHRFIGEDPARQARTRVDLERLRQQTKPIVLMISHQRSGGVEHHCEQITEMLADEAEFLLLTPASDGLVRLGWLRCGETLSLHYDINKNFEHLTALLSALPVAHMHYHHLLGHDWKVTQLPDALGLKFDVTLHDFAVACPQITMTQDDGRYCGEQGLEQCRKCLQSLPHVTSETIETWRLKHGDWLRRAHRVIAPSQDTARRIKQYFSDINVLPIPHPEGGKAASAPVTFTPPARDEPIRVAVLGALSREKGADVLEAMSKYVAHNRLPIRFKLFGYAYRHLKEDGVLEISGAYDEPNLPALLEEWRPHIAWFPAQCPETWSYTLSRCQHAGLPVLASRLGALTERLQYRPLSTLIPHDSSCQAWAEALMSYREVASTHDSHRHHIVTDADFYMTRYLEGLSGRVGSTLPENCTSHFSQSLHQRRGWRHALIDVLYRTRQLSWLSPIARKIPTSLQRRIKSLILRESR